MRPSQPCCPSRSASISSTSTPGSAPTTAPTSASIRTRCIPSRIGMAWSTRISDPSRSSASTVSGTSTGRRSHPASAASPSDSTVPPACRSGHRSQACARTTRIQNPSSVRPHTRPTPRTASSGGAARVVASKRARSHRRFEISPDVSSRDTTAAHDEGRPPVTADTSPVYAVRHGPEVSAPAPSPPPAGGCVALPVCPQPRSDATQHASAPASAPEVMVHLAWSRRALRPRTPPSSSRARRFTPSR